MPSATEAVAGSRLPTSPSPVPAAPSATGDQGVDCPSPANRPRTPTNDSGSPANGTTPPAPTLPAASVDELALGLSGLGVTDPVGGGILPSAGSASFIPLSEVYPVGIIPPVYPEGYQLLGPAFPGQRRKGKCKFFNSLKGFGFLLDYEPEALGHAEVFVHYSAIDSVQEGPRGFRSLCEGEDVEYTITNGAKGWQAQNVTGPGGAPCIGTPGGGGGGGAQTSMAARGQPRPMRGGKGAGPSMGRNVDFRRPSLPYMQQGAEERSFYVAPGQNYSPQGFYNPPLPIPPEGVPYRSLPSNSYYPPMFYPGPPSQQGQGFLPTPPSEFYPLPDSRFDTRPHPQHQPYFSPPYGQLPLPGPDGGHYELVMPEGAYEAYPPQPQWQEQSPPFPMRRIESKGGEGGGRGDGLSAGS